MFCSKCSKLNIFYKFNIIFLLLIPFCFISFYFEKSSFFVFDGISQHVNALAYVGIYFRKLIINLVHFNFVLPQWDFNIGFGADILTTLHYYSFGDPIDLFSIFCPVKFTDRLYVILIFFRMMLAGLAFIAYARNHSCTEYGTLLGSLIYVFCGYVFYCSVRHPYFINPMIYLPLLCLGIDRVFEGRSQFFFTIVVFLACVSNFYFFYMLSLIVLGYALLLFFFKVHNLRAFPKYFFRAFIPFVLGVLVACPIFLPQINSFFSSGRVDETNELLTWLYRPQYYFKMILGICSPSTFGSYSVLGFAAPVFVMILSLFLEKDKSYLPYKVAIFCTFIMLSLPIFGCIFNGFNYVTNRWCFSVSMIVSFMVAKKIDCLISNDKTFKTAILCSFCYSLFVCIVSLFNKDVRNQFLLCHMVIAIYSVLVFIKKEDKRTIKVISFVFIILSIIINANFRYSKSGLNYLQRFQKSDVANNKLKEIYTSFPIKINSNEFYRIETSCLKLQNSPCVAGYHGTTYYWSMNNENLYDLYRMKGIPGNALHCFGLDDNYDLYSLFNVKYLIGNIGMNKKGFSDTGIRYLDYSIYENENFVPFGFLINHNELPIFENCDISKLQKRKALKIDRISSNKILGTVSDVKENEVMIFSIPYSSGWKAYVDGETEPLVKTDYAFTALYLKSGSHNIVLQYSTPLLKIGIIFLFIGIIGIIVDLIIRKKVSMNNS